MLGTSIIMPWLAVSWLQGYLLDTALSRKDGGPALTPAGAAFGGLAAELDDL